MEESLDTEEILKKLKSSLPICRICLDISMEYIEFETTLCVVNGQDITFSEGLRELIPNDKDLNYTNFTTNFCATCGKDLLNAYLFMKRIEHANYALHKVKIFMEESPSKFLAEAHVNESDDEPEQKNMIYFLNLESESCKEKENVDIYQDKSEDVVKNTASNISLSTFDELIKIENNLEENCKSEYEEVFDSEESMEKEEILSESAETHIVAKEVDSFETDSNRGESESPMWVSNDCEFQYDREDESTEKYEFNSHEKELVKCIHCDELLEKTVINSHMLKFHDTFNIDKKSQEKKDYICTICSVAFPSKRTLNFHNRQIHKSIETNYQKVTEYKKCQYCRRMIRKSNMEAHLVTHSIETGNVYKCTLCDETLPTKIGLKQHSYTHTKNHNPYACHICGKICLRPYTLKNHIQAKHMSERRKHQCEDCGLFFLFPSLLKEHRRKHNMNNRFKCSHCDRTFVRKPQLDIHMRYHLNDFPYKCDQCDKCYVSKSNLTDHIRSKHTNITYDCDRCKQTFRSQTGLRKHKFAHDGYPYNCPLCSVGQTSRSGMKQHLMGVHKDAITEEEFDIMFPIIIPRTGYRRPKNMYTNTIEN